MTTRDEVEALSFADFIAAHRSGDTEVELTDRLDALARAVDAQQMKGSMTIKIDLLPMETGGLKVAMAVSTETPEPKIKPAVFFPAKGGLSRIDPLQHDLEERTEPGRDGSRAIAARPVVVSANG